LLASTAGLLALTGTFASLSLAGSGEPPHHHDGGGTTTAHHSAGYCGLDAEWLKTSLSGDLFEIQGGKLALSKSKDPSVDALANRLIADHTQSYNDGAELAKSLGIEVPTEPTPSQQWQLEELGEMQGATFNHDYTELEVLDHQQDISETQDEIDMGCNPDVKAEAAKDLPVLQMHLQLAEAAFHAVGPEPHGSTTH
jgi:putative membrane protein